MVTRVYSCKRRFAKISQPRTVKAHTTLHFFLWTPGLGIKLYFVTLVVSLIKDIYKNIKTNSTLKYYLIMLREIDEHTMNIMNSLYRRLRQLCMGLSLWSTSIHKNDNADNNNSAKVPSIVSNTALPVVLEERGPEAGSVEAARGEVITERLQPRPQPRPVLQRARAQHQRGRGPPRQGAVAW